MKKYTSLFIMGLFAIVFTISCNNQESANNTTLSIDTDNTRAAQAEAMQVNFQGQMITIEASDMIGNAQAADAEGDAQTVMNINQTLMGAEKEAQLLDVNFTMSDEPVDNGMFIFGIETENAKELTLEMYDEEGFGMVANNKFDVTEGNNYKALNVQSLDAGTYNFRLKDEAGKELNKQVQIAATK